MDAQHQRCSCRIGTTFLFFKGIGLWTYVRTYLCIVTWQPKFLTSMGYQIFVWGSARAPSTRRSSAIILNLKSVQLTFKPIEILLIDPPLLSFYIWNTILAWPNVLSPKKLIFLHHKICRL